jgi:hypothetical protein
MSLMNIEFGNAGTLDTQGTGWFIGFSDWAKAGGPNLRHMAQDAGASALCVKWFAHPKGHPDGEPKPLSEGRTMSILVSETGLFQIDFSENEDFHPDSTVSHVLRRHGDFAIWGPGLYHRSFGRERATILTLRWLPESESP